MAHDLKLGFNTGYWSAGPPDGAPEAVAEADKLGYDSIWTAEAYGSDVLTPLAWWGAATTERAAGHGDHADVRAHAGRVGDGRDDDGPPLGRALHPGPRRVRAAGGGGLVRPAVRQAAGAHARVRGDRARHHGPRQPGHRGGAALPAAAGGRHRAGQAAEEHAAPGARADADLPGRRGPEERGAGRRDLRRLAGAVLQPPPRRLLPRGADRGPGPRRRPDHAGRSSRCAPRCR